MQRPGFSPFRTPAIKSVSRRSASRSARAATSSWRFSCRRKKSSGLRKHWRPAGAPSLRSAISLKLRHSAVRELFQPLIADGKQIALASSAKEDELAQYKKIANIGDQIAAETSSEDAEQSKPHFPAALPRLANKSPDRTIVVGDKPYDAEAAAKAGLRTTGLLCGGWSEDELRRSGCMAVFKTLPTCWPAMLNRR